MHVGDADIGEALFRQRVQIDVPVARTRGCECGFGAWIALARVRWPSTSRSSSRSAGGTLDVTPAHSWRPRCVRA